MIEFSLWGELFFLTNTQTTGRMRAENRKHVFKVIKDLLSNGWLEQQEIPPVRQLQLSLYVKIFSSLMCGCLLKAEEGRQRHLSLAFPLVSITGGAFRVGCLHEGWCNHTQFSANAYPRYKARIRKSPLPEIKKHQVQN